MRNCQISRQKAKYLRALSTAILDVDIDLDELPKLEETEIRKQLTSIKGIGEWTTDIYLMFCLQAKDIFPLGDIAQVTTIKELYGTNSKQEIIELTEKWKLYRSLAVYFLWHYYLKKRNRNKEQIIILFSGSPDFTKLNQEINLLNFILEKKYESFKN
jgi:DNA-3-methyladenine glycosylase II